MLNIETASSVVIASSVVDVDVNAGLTKISISYPKDWVKDKWHKEGEEIFVSKETAEHYISIGLGKIIADTTDVLENIQMAAKTNKKK